ncbi:hypothetical protein GOBAR_DD24585 [Gossypium barbadense]|nr:hypothetical protein GOBAR_DD24585 [Gossypium barbadense]
MTSSGESSSRRNATSADAEQKQLSPLSIITLQNIKNRPDQKSNRKLPGGAVRYFDNNDPRYSWLLDGWLAEERHVPSGKLYRNIKDRPHQKGNRKLPGGTVRYFDNNEPRYGWLLNGWLAEERRVPSGKLYRYYYDPVGRQYRTKTKVLCAWEKMGVIFIHP